MRFRIIIAVLTIALLAVAGTPTAESQTASSLLVSGATLGVATDVVNGNVISVESVDTGLEVHTMALVSVTEAVEGELTGEILVSVPGGTMNDGRLMSVSHMPYFQVGDHVQLSLMRSPVQRELRMTGGVPLYSVVGGLSGAAPITGNLRSQADAVTDFSLTGTSWNPNNQYTWPIDYRINTANSGLSGSVARASLLAAADEWVADPGSDIEVVQSPAATTASPDNFYDNINTVGWTPAEAGQLYLAQAVWISSGGETLSFDIRFNSNYTWADVAAGGSGFDVETVQLHEFGHVLGLGHISGTPQALGQVMYPSVSYGVIKGLGDGDRGAVASLYPAANPPAEEEEEEPAGDPNDDPPGELDCSDLAFTVVLSRGDKPTEGDDVILGTAGDDRINGRGGDDIICGGAGDDHLVGGDGNDRISGGAGDDFMRGKRGDDVLEGNGGNDEIFGSTGEDLVFGGSGDDRLVGNAHPDLLVGGTGADLIYGGAGRDDLAGEGGADGLYGGMGNDDLDGGDGVDELFGGSGSDMCEGVSC